MAVGKIGISLESHVIERLAEEAQARGIAKSRLVNTILSQALPRIKGKPFFSIQVLSETRESSWRSKIDLVSENREDLEMTMYLLSTLLLALKFVDERISFLKAHGLPTDKEGRERAGLVKQIDATLDSLASIAVDKLTDPQDRRRAQEFIQKNPVCVERMRRMIRRCDNERQHG